MMETSQCLRLVYSLHLGSIFNLRVIAMIIIALVLKEDWEME